MSFTALNWAWDQIAPSGVAKSVLVYLANCASKEGGDCYPSVPRISKAVQHGEETVRRALAQLVAKGLLEIEPRTAANGRQMSHLYRLPVVSIATPPDSGGTPSGWTPSWNPTPSKTGGYVNGQLLQGDPPEIEGGTPPNLGGNPLRDTEEREERTSLRSVSAREDAPAHDAKPSETKAVALTPKIDPQPVFDAWNETAQRCELPKVKRPSEATTRKLASLIKREGIDEVLAAIKAVEGSAWCTGDNPSGWRADFYFLLQPTSFARLISGFYVKKSGGGLRKSGLAMLRERCKVPLMRPVLEAEFEAEREIAR